jgi:phosphoribosylaminoimidazole-succinocarboxamide synthase
MRAFESGGRPPSFDKDVIRSWVVARCDPYKDPVPDIPLEMIEKTAQVYIGAYRGDHRPALRARCQRGHAAGPYPPNLGPFFTT